MKHKNPAPQTREMDIIVWCHNIHFKRQPQHHPRSHRLEHSSARSRGPSSSWPQWEQPHFHQDLVGWGNSTDSTGPPEQLSWWWMGCRNAPVSAQPGGFTLKPSHLQSHHKDPHFSSTLFISTSPTVGLGASRELSCPQGLWPEEPPPAVQLPLTVS